MIRIRIRITVEIVEGVGSDTGGTGLEAGGRVGGILSQIIDGDLAWIVGVL